MPGKTYTNYSTVSFANTKEESVYPHNRKCGIDLRCHESYIFDAKIATNHDTSFRGIGSTSSFLTLKYFKLPYMVPVDAMHVLDLGIGKYFLDLWLGGGPKHVPENRARESKNWLILSPETLEN